MPYSLWMSSWLLLVWRTLTILALYYESRFPHGTASSTKITDKNGKELGFLGFKENDDCYIILTPEGSEDVITFYIEEAGDIDLYSFDNGDGQTLYMDMKLKMPNFWQHDEARHT